MNDQRKPKRMNLGQRNIQLGQVLNERLQEKARMEHRSPSEMGKLLIEWALNQLEIAGTIIELFKCSIGREEQAAGEGAEHPVDGL